VLNRIADALETPQQAEFYKRAETKVADSAQGSGLRKQATAKTKAMLTRGFGALDIDVSFLDDAQG